MNTSDSFSASFPEARLKFLTAAENANGKIERFTHPEKGPEGIDLSTDVAWFGDSDSPKVFVIISGTHGVEGYCGSGVQIDLLRRMELERVPMGTAVMMVHAINPFGFAWDRRVTEDNVDLNRNWIEFKYPLPQNTDYGDLHELLCPQSWDEVTQKQSTEALFSWEAKNGKPAFQQAWSGGQYQHKNGIFFGGTGPTWSRRTQCELFQSRLSHAHRVAIIDIHAGLGPWGFGERIVTSRRGDAVFQRAESWFGASITSPLNDTSISARVVGDGLSAAAALLPNTEVTAMALEFGTLSLMEVLDALRADAWLHTYGKLNSAIGRKIKKQIRNAFYGDTDDWKGMVVGQSLLACRQALAGLQSD